MKTAYSIMGIMILLVIGGIFLLKPGSGATNGNLPEDKIISGETQQVSIGFKNGNYYPNTITVKQGEPVELTLDSSVGGCYRSFTIKELGVSKYSKTPEQKIIFTPSKVGTFRFACSMGMGTGTIKVEES